MTFHGTDEQLINALHETAARLTGPKAAICTAAAERLAAFARIVAARKAYVEAATAYNTRLALVTSERSRGNWSMKVDDEARIMWDAQSAFIKAAQDEADDALKAKGCAE